jgi:uncharacterized protein YqgC (DUF456 family)
VRQHKKAVPVPKRKPAPKPIVAAPAAVKHVALASAPVAASTGGSATARLLALIGVAIGFFAIGLSLVPVYALPVSIGLPIHRNRQTIMLTGLAVSFGCAIGLLSTVAG